MNSGRSSGASLVAASMFGLLLSLMMAPIVSRILGPEVRGEFYVTLAVVTSIGALSNLGVATTIRRATHFSQKIPISTLATVTLVSISCMLVILLLSTTDSLPLLTGVPLWALLGFGALIPLFANFNSTLLGRKDFGASALISGIQPIFQLGSLPLYLWFRAPLENLLALMIFCGFVTQVIMLGRRVRSKANDSDYYVEASRRDLAGVKFVPKTIFNELRFRIDLVLVGLFLGPNVAGQYSVALTFSTALTAFEQWLTARFYPFTVAANIATPKLEFWKMQVEIMAPLFAASAVSVAISPIIPYLFGSEFQTAASLVTPAFGISAVVVGTSVNLELLTARGRTPLFLLPFFIITAVLLASVGTTFSSPSSFLFLWMAISTSVYLTSLRALFSSIYNQARR